MIQLPQWLREFLVASTSVPDRFNALEQRVTVLETQMATLQDLRDHVTALHDKVQAAITRLQELAQQLHDALAQNDPTAVQQVIDQIDAEAQALSDATNVPTP